MLALIRKLSRERGIGVIVVLHDINMAARYCDEIIALGGGRLVARGTPDEIVDGEVLARHLRPRHGHPASPGDGQPDELRL